MKYDRTDWDPQREFQDWSTTRSTLAGTDALVVVDMQPVFEAANCHRTLAAVEGEIRQARKLGWWVVLVEKHLKGTPTSRADTVFGSLGRSPRAHLVVAMAACNDDMSGGCRLSYEPIPRLELSIRSG